MNVPALAARPPAGATQTIVGHVRLEERPDDRVGRLEAAAGRVEPDDDR